jgi:hypothetical protein
MAELPHMIWDPRAEKFVPLDTDGERVKATERRILLALIESRKVREAAKADWLEAVQTSRALIDEGLRYHIPVTDLAAAAGSSRQMLYKGLPSIEESEMAWNEGASQDGDTETEAS